MRPSSRALIESIIAAIDDTILPAVEDKQAASSLRAARTLLTHLAVRVELESAMLAADNADAAATLELPDEGGTAAERNLEFQRTIDDMLRGMPIAGRESAEQAALRAKLRGYLSRRHARERDMIFPAFLGTPF